VADLDPVAYVMPRIEHDLFAVSPRRVLKDQDVLPAVTCALYAGIVAVGVCVVPRLRERAGMMPE